MGGVTNRIIFESLTYINAHIEHIEWRYFLT